MPKKREVDHHAVTHELRRIRFLCGEPTYATICAISSKFPVSDVTQGSPSPSITALGDLFSGKRIKFPSWETLAPILWACYQYAKEAGLMPKIDSSAKTREAWARLVELAIPPTSPQGAPQDDRTPTMPISIGATSRGRVSTAVSSEEFFPELRWYANAYGQVGTELFRAAAAGESEAAYRLGVVTTVDRHPRKARSWLAAARDGSHLGATQLLASAPASKTGRASAIECAYLLGHAAHHGGGSRAHAMFYYQCAAKAGHPDAAYHLANFHLSLSENGLAANWFSIAGKTGNLDAERQLSKLKRQ
ncbi:hypothetical protein [Streptosporangium sp. NPDC049046]|uniref:hypothetical protein n=1 Tax=Streptosporangium sp. NPDC049046 TaxID=3155031 RepID=UPI00342EF663